MKSRQRLIIPLAISVRSCIALHISCRRWLCIGVFWQLFRPIGSSKASPASFSHMLTTRWVPCMVYSGFLAFPELQAHTRQVYVVGYH